MDRRYPHLWVPPSTIRVADVGEVLALQGLPDGRIVRGPDGQLRIWSASWGGAVPAEVYEAGVLAEDIRLTGDQLPAAEDARWTDETAVNGTITVVDGAVRWLMSGTNDLARSARTHGHTGPLFVSGFFRIPSWAVTGNLATLWLEDGTRRVNWRSDAATDGLWQIHTEAQGFARPTNVRTYLEMFLSSADGALFWGGLDLLMTQKYSTLLPVATSRFVIGSASAATTGGAGDSRGDGLRFGLVS
jgi:hypothetical protein